MDVGTRQGEIVVRACVEEINLRIGEGTLGVALDETTTSATVEAVWRAFGGKLSYVDIEVSARETLPAELKRGSAFLTHPVFHAHRSETELLRYMRKLSDRDLALDRAMIPLGSCTMKLNATTEMIPLTWPEFGNLHPFAHAYRLSARFSDASGVFKGDAVKLAGVDVGRVQGTRIDNGQAVVTFTVGRAVKRGCSTSEAASSRAAISRPP